MLQKWIDPICFSTCLTRANLWVTNMLVHQPDLPQIEQKSVGMQFLEVAYNILAAEALVLYELFNLSV